jgi:5-methylcytosine-specific restriction endonuclease McrA
VSKVPSRWLPFVLDVATRPGRLQARAEQLVQQHQASHARKLARTLPRRKAAKAEHQEKTGARKAVRGAVVSRAGGRCEACGVEVTSRSGELDHFFGRARSENVETCWLLCGACHFAKTNWMPARAAWLNRFRRHALLHGFGRAIPMVDQLLALEPAVQEASGG